MTTIHSDWGDWLPNAVSAADPDGLAMWYLGCNGFIVKSSGGTTLCIDPYLDTGSPPRTIRMIPVPFEPDDLSNVDAVFATHEHSDHVDGPSQGPILESTGATFFGPSESIGVVESEGWLNEFDIDDGQIESIADGDRFTVGDITISVEPANDPDAEEPVSYVLEHDGETFFHGGDARPGEFETVGQRYDIDVAALAFGTTGLVPDKGGGGPKRTTWYNDENMIIEAANELQVDRLVPTHWDMWKGLRADPTVLHHHKASFEYPRVLDVVEIGDRVDLPA